MQPNARGLRYSYYWRTICREYNASSTTTPHPLAASDACVVGHRTSKQNPKKLKHSSNNPQSSFFFCDNSPRAPNSHISRHPARRCAKNKTKLIYLYGQIQKQEHTITIIPQLEVARQADISAVGYGQTATTHSERRKTCAHGSRTD